MNRIRKNLSASVCLLISMLAISSAQAQLTPVQSNSGAGGKQQNASPEATFTRWDKDKNGVLSQAEFIAGWQEIQAAIILRKLHDNFVAMDTNKNGGLEAAEYANLELIKQAGNSAPPMLQFDLDKNQRLEFKEYLAMVSAMKKHKQ